MFTWQLLIRFAQELAKHVSGDCAKPTKRKRRPRKKKEPSTHKPYVTRKKRGKK